MSKNNLNQCVKLISELYHSSQEEILLDLLKIIDSNYDIVLLGYQDNALIGFSHISLRGDYVEGCDANPVGYLEGVYVLSQYRHQG